MVLPFWKPGRKAPPVEDLHLWTLKDVESFLRNMHCEDPHTDHALNSLLLCRENLGRAYRGLAAYLKGLDQTYQVYLHCLNLYEYSRALVKDPQEPDVSNPKREPARQLLQSIHSPFSDFRIAFKDESQYNLRRKEIEYDLKEFEDAYNSARILLDVKDLADLDRQTYRMMDKIFLIRTHLKLAIENEIGDRVRIPALESRREP